MVRGECALSAVYCAGMARALGSARSPQRFDALAAIEQRGGIGEIDWKLYRHYEYRFFKGLVALPDYVDWS